MRASGIDHVVVLCSDIERTLAWWQTELGWPALGTCLGLGDRATRHGSAGKPIPGFRFAVLDAAEQEQPAGEIGDIVLRLPLPPGLGSRLVCPRVL